MGMGEFIENGVLTAGFAAHTPELYSLKKGGREYIWQRDPAFWAKSAPMLFPIVGRQKNGRYTLNGQSYSIGLHGIMDELKTEVLENSGSSVTFLTLPTEKSEEAYPFDFRMVSRFQLAGNTLTVTRTIENLGEVPMPFCIGEHPGFACADPSEAVLRFSKEEKTTRAYLNSDHYIGREEKLTLRELSVADESFLEGAVILRTCESEYISLIDGGEETLRIFGDDYPAVAMWRKPGAPFICVEPLHGFDSYFGDSEDFFVKRNLVILAKGESRSFSFRIEIC